jgi:hypothetical protein
MYKVKMRKKTVMILSFAVGSLMFATTAMAVVASKSGYEQLKDALKTSSESCAVKLSSYTLDRSIVVKDNGKIISSEDSVKKYDRLNAASEITTTSITTSINGSKKKNVIYNFSNKNGSIYYNSDEDTYYVNEGSNEAKTQFFIDPFKEKTAGDMERIVDALIGNLKDSVVVSEKTDGSKELSGAVSEAQIPAIANALVSYELKSAYGISSKGPNSGIESTFPNVLKDIYVKEIKGNVIVTKEGLIQSILGTAILSGKADDGTEHNLTFELLGKLVDVDLTKVNKPDLSGKKVQTSAQNAIESLSNPEKFMGTYKKDIVIEKEGKFKKIGEAFVDITSFDNKAIVGRYHDEFNKDFETYAANKKDIVFNAKFKNDNHTYVDFDTNSSSGKGIKGNININSDSANIFFNISENSNDNILRDGTFHRVFN